MKVLIIHNDYGRPSGEEAVVEQLSRLLLARGHAVCQFRRRSADIPTRRWGQFRACFSGLYSASATRELAALIAREQPDLANVHNLYPLISPAALAVCGRLRLPVLMTVHNYRLLCPNGLFYTHDKVCERCLGHAGWACLWRNCEGSWPKSGGYALRHAWARWRGYFQRYVRCFATLTEFQRQKLIAAGFAAGRVTVLPNALPDCAPPAVGPAGTYAAYVGRLSREKGFDLLLAAAAQRPEIPFRLAGNWREGARPPALPGNVTWVGQLPAAELRQFYADARFVVLPSRCYEGLSITLLEALRAGKPVIGPNHGGFPEVIAAGETGLLFTPGNVPDLARCLTELWTAPDRCVELGRQAYARFRARYTEDRYYEQFSALMNQCVAPAPP